jgi:hypothetical protein
VSPEKVQKDVKSIMSDYTNIKFKFVKPLSTTFTSFSRKYNSSSDVWKAISNKDIGAMPDNILIQNKVRDDITKLVGGK